MNIFKYNGNQTATQNFKIGQIERSTWENSGEIFISFFFAYFEQSAFSRWHIRHWLFNFYNYWIVLAEFKFTDIHVCSKVNFEIKQNTHDKNFFLKK